MKPLLVVTVYELACVRYSWVRTKRSLNIVQLGNQVRLYTLVDARRG